MNSTRLVFRIHSWLGLITGVFLLIMILSGVYLVYRAELDRWANPELRVRPVAARTASIDQMVSAARTSFPDLRAGYLMFPTEPWMTFVAFLREKGPDGEVIRHQVYIDTGTGQVVGHRLSYHFLADWMVRIHEGLWLPDFWGQPLVALTGVILALASLTGLWVYRGACGTRSAGKMRRCASGGFTRTSEYGRSFSRWCWASPAPCSITVRYPCSSMPPWRLRWKG